MQKMQGGPKPTILATHNCVFLSVAVAQVPDQFRQSGQSVFIYKLYFTIEMVAEI